MKTAHRHRYGPWEKVASDGGWMRTCKAVHCDKCNALCLHHDFLTTRPNRRHRHVFRRPRGGVLARARKERGLDIRRCSCGRTRRRSL